MTPAIQLARKQNIEHIIHEYQHDANYSSYGLEAAEKLNVDVDRVFKTLVVRMENGKLAVGVLPVSHQLSMKLFAKAIGAKKVDMADAADVQRSTGYVLGGVSPLGQKKRLPTIIDVSAESFDTVYISAGRRGLDIELKPSDLIRLTSAKSGNICQ